MTASSRDYRTYVCNLPNHKNEDRFSETFLSIKGPVTILGVYDGETPLGASPIFSFNFSLVQVTGESTVQNTFSRPCLKYCPVT
jgi:hypothetical protein